MIKTDLASNLPSGMQERVINLIMMYNEYGVYIKRKSSSNAAL